jgi:hypothetical protein
MADGTRICNAGIFQEKYTNAGGCNGTVAESPVGPDLERESMITKGQVRDSRQVNHIKVWLTTQGTAAGTRGAIRIKDGMDTHNEAR